MNRDCAPAPSSELFRQGFHPWMSGQWEVTLFFRHRRDLVDYIELETKLSRPPQLTYSSAKIAGASALTQPKLPEGTSEDRMVRFIR